MILGSVGCRNDGSGSNPEVSDCHGHVNVVALLLNFGADIAKRDRDGRSALDVAQKQGHTKIVNLLS